MVRVIRDARCSRHSKRRRLLLRSSASKANCASPTSRSHSAICPDTADGGRSRPLTMAGIRHLLCTAIPAPPITENGYVSYFLVMIVASPRHATGSKNAPSDCEPVSLSHLLEVIQGKRQSSMATTFYCRWVYDTVVPVDVFGAVMPTAIYLHQSRVPHVSIVASPHQLIQSVSLPYEDAGTIVSTSASPGSHSGKAARISPINARPAPAQERAPTAPTAELAPPDSPGVVSERHSPRSVVSTARDRPEALALFAGR
ncbi:hypothetical protein AURDEDRAFT_178467 [Auricularia subglabra TFB-10046 SS5]|uniref:Uncharacterized protein n=1 Tax=Auricularia subglabra (strain TFB-10046 / SS5) TaxID=717982 RepID=J0CQJ0_AURST|nr:hypothetical protein AURDEDRAFT_178467 [Auricularia subglabra TFB-10046 SS5]